jgi:hypothetical protein
MHYPCLNMTFLNSVRPGLGCKVCGMSLLASHSASTTTVPYQLQLGYLEVTVQEKLRSDWPGPFVKIGGFVISHSFAFSASRRIKFSYKSILPCTAFPSTLVSMLELSPPLPVLLLLRVGELSRLNTARVKVKVKVKVTLQLTVEEKLGSGWQGPLVKVEGCCD